MKKNLPAMLLIAASAALAVISFILLPQTVIVQFSTGGSGVTTMPKLFAIALPLALGAGGAAFGLAAKGDEKMKQKVPHRVPRWHCGFCDNACGQFVRRMI